jgi:hypothetical protein
MARTTDALVTAVTARVGRPAADGLLSDAELLARLDEEMRTDLAGKIVTARSEYWLTTSTTAIAADQSDYRLPDRCLGNALRDVTIYETVNPTNERDLEQIGAADRLEIGTSTGDPSHFMLKDGKIQLLPTPAVSGYTLRFAFYRSPPELIATTSAAAISSAFSSTVLVLIVSPTPPSTVTATAGLVDIVRGAGMYDVISENSVSNWSSPNLTLSTAIDTTEIATSTVTNQRADYVCPLGQTVYPPLPDVFWPALVALGCRVYCEAIKDVVGMRAANDVYERKVAAALGIVVPRVDGEPKKIRPRHTPLRSGSRSGVTRSVR